MATPALEEMRPVTCELTASPHHSMSVPSNATYFATFHMVQNYIWAIRKYATLASIYNKNP